MAVLVFIIFCFSYLQWEEVETRHPFLFIYVVYLTCYVLGHAKSSNGITV